jgi:predicted nucleic acid-binding protein
MPDTHAVIDASAMVDLLLRNSIGDAVQHAVTATTLHAPAHFDVEVLSALARLHRAGHLDDQQIEQRLEHVRDAPIERHAANDLLEPAWAMRHNVRITDGVYLALATVLDTRVITTDRALARAAPERTRLVDDTNPSPT